MRVAIERDLARLEAVEARLVLGKLTEIPALLIHPTYQASTYPTALLHIVAHRRRWLRVLVDLTEAIDDVEGEEPGWMAPVVTTAARLARRLQEYGFTPDEDKDLRNAIATLWQYVASEARLPAAPTGAKWLEAIRVISRGSQHQIALALLDSLEKGTVDGQPRAPQDPFRVKIHELRTEIQTAVKLKHPGNEWLAALANRKLEETAAAVASPQHSKRPQAPTSDDEPPRPPAASVNSAHSDGDFLGVLGILWDEGDEAVAAA